MNLAIQDDFPILHRRIDGKPLSYLDSAATSLKPKAVLSAESAYNEEFTANVHRGHSALSEEASYRYETARRSIARFIKADPGCVVMTPNTSVALSMVAFGLKLNRDKVVLCSANSHHSNLLPWLRAASVGYIGGDPLETIQVDELIVAIKKWRPAVFAFGWVSNVNGKVSPAAELCRVAREYGVITVVDAAQAAPHLPIDVDALGADFLAFSGHKVLGPAGTGVLWGRSELLEQLEPLVVAGGTIDRVSLSGYTLKRLPYRLEPGTPNIGGVIGLGAALDYLADLDAASVFQHERALSIAMHESLQDLPGVRVLTAVGEGSTVAIASIVPITANIHSDTMCQILSDTYKIMTRSGFHCAHPLFDGAKFKYGAVRLSAYIYNSSDEVRAAGDAVRAILSRIGSD